MNPSPCGCFPATHGTLETSSPVAIASGHQCSNAATVARTSVSPNDSGDTAPLRRSNASMPAMTDSGTANAFNTLRLG